MIATVLAHAVCGVVLLLVPVVLGLLWRLDREGWGQ